MLDAGDLAPQARDLPLDAHVHTDLSPDANVPIDVYAADAVELGDPALEVNTSGLRQGPGETYPAGPIVERYAVLGGTAVTAGSDSHQKGSFTAGLEAGYGVIAAAGYGLLAFRRGGSRVEVALPDRFRTRGGVDRADT
jgi:hypothetical protein